MARHHNDPHNSWYLRLVKKKRIKTQLKKAVQEMYNINAKKRDVTTLIGSIV